MKGRIIIIFSLNYDTLKVKVKNIHLQLSDLKVVLLYLSRLIENLPITNFELEVNHLGGNALLTPRLQSKLSLDETIFSNSHWPNLIKPVRNSAYLVFGNETENIYKL